MNKVKRKKGINDKYNVNQLQFICKLKKILIHNDTKPRKENIRKYTKINRFIITISKQRYQTQINT